MDFRVKAELRLAKVKERYKVVTLLISRQVLMQRFRSSESYESYWFRVSVMNRVSVGMPRARVRIEFGWEHCLFVVLWTEKDKPCTC
eukprot:1190652-Amorphochlora_amoeboformis.AAC.1